MVVWHDASDTVVKVDESRAIVRYVRGMKYDVDYDETQSVGHAPTPQILEQEYSKLRPRTRASIRTICSFNPTAPTRFSIGSTGCKYISHWTAGRSRA